jgi:hypothetical protein
LNYHFFQSVAYTFYLALLVGVVVEGTTEHNETLLSEDPISSQPETAAAFDEIQFRQVEIKRLLI